jgi:hypothetical protein
VFLYRGKQPLYDDAELLEVADPYLKDYSAHDAFARAEMIARKDVPNRRYVYVPGTLPREIVGEVWRTLSPKETVVTAEDQDVLPPVPFDRIRRHSSDGNTVLHMFTSKTHKPAEAAKAG